MKAILSADLNWGIGYKGQLLQRVPEDMKYFKKMTAGKVVVMGRETFESLPGKQPLKDRINIVLTKNSDYDAEGLIICHSIKALFEELKAYQPEEVFVIGGQMIYTLLLPYCSEVYITRFEKAFEADRYFPDLDKLENWELAEESTTHYHNDMGFRFTKYENKSVQIPQ
jgi:dihydrofolate reductase